MTSLPGPGELLRSLLPNFGRGGPGLALGLGQGQGPGDLDLDEGPRGPHRGPAGDRIDMRHPVHGLLRGEGGQPLSPGDASRLADTLSQAMRQDPSHPLYRELTQLPTGVVRQLIQFVNQHVPAGREIPQHIGEALLQATVRPQGEGRPPSAGPQGEGRPPAADVPRLPAEAARSMAHAHSQPQGQPGQGAQSAGPPGQTEGRAAAQLREWAAPTGERRGEDARWMAAATLAGPRSASAGGPQDAGVPTMARPEPSPATARTARPAEISPLPIPLALASPAAGAPQGATAAPAPVSSMPLEPAPQQAPPTRADAATLPARAEVPGVPGGPTMAAAAGDPASPGGLPGLAGAAGVTLVAVGQPAGTTFAHAPAAAVRARKADESGRTGEDVQAGRTGRKQTREGKDGGPGDHRDDSRGRQAAPAGAAPGAPGEARRTATTTGAAAPAGSPGVPGHAAPGGGAGPSAGAASPQDAGEAPAAAAQGHTAAMSPGMRAARERANGPAMAEARAAAALADGEEATDAAAATRDPWQWLYWGLIAVTYGCLGVALVLFSPDRFGLSIGTDAATTWRNALTATGLLSGLWAWLLARRLR